MPAWRVAQEAGLNYPVQLTQLVASGFIVDTPLQRDRLARVARVVGFEDALFLDEGGAA